MCQTVYQKIIHQKIYQTYIKNISKYIQYIQEIQDKYKNPRPARLGPSPGTRGPGPAHARLRAWAGPFRIYLIYRFYLGCTFGHYLVDLLYFFIYFWIYIWYTFGVFFSFVENWQNKNWMRVWSLNLSCSGIIALKFVPQTQGPRSGWAQKGINNQLLN